MIHIFMLFILKVFSILSAIGSILFLINTGDQKKFQHILGCIITSGLLVILAVSVYKLSLSI